MDRGRRLRRMGTLALAQMLLGGGIALILLGNAVGGVALLMVGWFARSAVKARQRRDKLARVIEGLTVGEVMETVAFVVAPQATLETFAPALDGAGDATVARVERGQWAVAHAADAMTDAGGLPVLDPDDALGPAADRLGALSAPGLPVVREGTLAGILTRLAVGRTLHERAAADADRGRS